VTVWAVCVENVDVGELEAFERGFGALDQVFARDTEVVDLVTWRVEGGVVCAPVDLYPVLVCCACRVKMYMYLGRDDNVASCPTKMFDSPSHYFLRLPLCIAFSTIEKIYTTIESCFEAGKRIVIANMATIGQPTTE
jgi:hypothetical protein